MKIRLGFGRNAAFVLKATSDCRPETKLVSTWLGCLKNAETFESGNPVFAQTENGRQDFAKDIALKKRAIVDFRCPGEMLSLEHFQ